MHPSSINCIPRNRWISIDGWGKPKRIIENTPWVYCRNIPSKFDFVIPIVDKLEEKEIIMIARIRKNRDAAPLI